MIPEHEDREFLEQVKRHLDEKTQGLDSGILSRLTRARHRALESQSALWWSRWLGLPATGLAAAAALILALVLTLGGPAPQLTGGPLEDLDLLASRDQLELYEDMDFYAWLAEESANTHEAG